jgi:hypothetical protein
VRELDGPPAYHLTNPWFAPDDAPVEA